MPPLFMVGDTVRHHIYGTGKITSIGYRIAFVLFQNGAQIGVTTDNLTRVFPT